MLYTLDILSARLYAQSIGALFKNIQFGEGREEQIMVSSD